MSASFGNSEFFVLEREMRGVKKITEKRHTGQKIVSFYNKDGFLVRQVFHYGKFRKEEDLRYEYSISDTLLVIRERDRLEERWRIRKRNQDNHIMKYYYNHLKQCYKFEYYSPTARTPSKNDPFVWGDNFIYENNQLQSWERYAYGYHQKDDNTLGLRAYFQSRFVYSYDSNKQVERRCQYVYTYDSIKRTDEILGFEYWDYIRIDSTLRCGSTRTSIFQDGKLTDIILEISETAGIFGSSYGWKNKRKHTRFSKFDERGNWTQSHYITEEGELFRSERKIEYW
jgi:hypothetical protein